MGVEDIVSDWLEVEGRKQRTSGGSWFDVLSEVLSDNGGTG